MYNSFKKIKSYGFDVKSVKLVQSYLCERLQSVFYNGCFSQYLKVHTGMPPVISMGNWILTRKCIGPYYKPSLYEQR